MSADDTLADQLQATLDGVRSGESLRDIRARCQVKPVMYRVGERASVVFNRHNACGEKIVPLRCGFAFGAIRKNNPPPEAA